MTDTSEFQEFEQNADMIGASDRDSLLMPEELPDTEEISADFDGCLDLYDEGRYEEALTSLQRLEQIAPYASEIKLHLGNCCFQLEKLDNASLYWRKAIELDPLEATAYLNLGNLYFKEEKIKLAIHYWEAYKKLVKNNATVFLNLGIAYDKLMNPEKALDNYNIFLGLKPATVEAARLRVRFETGKVGFEKNIRQAEQYLAKNKRRQAKEVFDKSLTIYPGTFKIYKAYASLLYQDGEIEKAQDFYERALEKEPKDPSTLINLGVIYEKQQKYVDAMWAYSIAQSLSSDDRRKVIERFQKLLEVVTARKMMLGYFEDTERMFKHQRFQEAMKQTMRMLTLSHYDLALPDFKANATKLYERIDDAQNPVNRACKLFYHRGSKAQEEGRFDQAINDFNKFLSLKAEGPIARDVRSRLDHIKEAMGAVVNSMLDVDEH